MKTVLLTGASSGIGLAIAQRLVTEGYEVYGIGRHFDTATPLTEGFHPILCDLTDTPALLSTIKKLQTVWGVPAPDVLIHSAGVGYYGLHETLEDASIQELVRTNLEAPMLLTSHLLAYMKQRKSGHILFLSSVTARKSNTYGCAYGATKAALLSFANSLFDEVRKNNIKVTTLLPDMTKTNLYRNADFEAADDACLFPEDVAAAVSYVLSAGEHLNFTEMTIQPRFHRIQKK